MSGKLPGEMSGEMSGDSFGHSGCARVRMRRTRAKPLVNAGPTASATFCRSLHLVRDDAPTCGQHGEVGATVDLAFGTWS